MKPLFAILIDGGFITKKLKQKLGRCPGVRDIQDYCTQLRNRPEFDHYELLRIYYYDADPYEGETINPLSSKITSNGGASDAKKMLERLEMATNFAVRKGQTVFRGWKLREGNDYLKKGIAAKDLQANIMQKGVDLHIGIDIARLSIKERVRAIAVVTGDADMIPAFQLAREEGVRVYLACLGQSVTRDLIVNTDCLIQDTEDLNNA